jgi:septal ring factor EnvC (AmiA/AmiB activator)
MVKLKELFTDSKAKEDLEEQLKVLQRKIKTATRSIEDQETILKSSIKEIHIAKEEQEELAKKTKSLVNELEKAAKSLNKTTAELALFKPRLEKELLTKFTNSIEKELANTTNKIHAESAGFNFAKEVFSKHIEQSKQAMDEVAKLQTISKTIKEKDFSLEKYSKELDKKDQEKLRLLKKIDELESMLARMKRSNNRPY